MKYIGIWNSKTLKTIQWRIIYILAWKKSKLEKAINSINCILWKSSTCKVVYCLWGIYRLKLIGNLFLGMIQDSGKHLLSMQLWWPQPWIKSPPLCMVPWILLVFSSEHYCRVQPLSHVRYIPSYRVLIIVGGNTEF